MQYTVTIGRQNGSGGRDVGRILAERMGVPCYDWEIVTEVAAKNGKTVKEVEAEEENTRTRSKFFFGGVPSANPLFEQQSEVIREFASRGPAVFVGRCADYVLSDRKDVINTFIGAPLPARVERSMERNGISRDDAIKRVTNKDSARANYYMLYTGRTWADVTNYHITLNSDAIGIEGCVDMLLEYMKRL